MTSVRTAVFTICSNNYMPMARVFLESMQRVHPEFDRFICLVDQVIQLDILYNDETIIVPVEKLDIPDMSSFTFRYDIMELNTAVKPFMFLYLIESLEYDRVLYFDPDIEVFAPLSAVLSALDEGASLALTPHVLQPAEGPDEPNDINFLRAGTYNLGFFAVQRDLDALAVLHWWARRLLYQCINDQSSGLFVDQKFMDLVPGFVSHVAILRDSSLNVAYWNLNQRTLSCVENEWMIDDHPLVFFHYSGFDPRKPTRLSKHTHLFNGDNSSVLDSLLESYAARLLAFGHGTIPRGTYAFGHFASGTPIPNIVRRYFREHYSSWPHDPFKTFEEQLHCPWAGPDSGSSAVMVTKFQKYIHETSPYLSSCMDIATPQGQLLLVDWFLKHAARDLALDSRLIQPTALRWGNRLPITAIPVSVFDGHRDMSVIGYLRATSGVGEVGRLNLTALSEAGLHVDGYDVSLGVVSERSDESMAPLLTEQPRGRVRLFNINADQLPLVMENMGSLLIDKSYTIVNPAWELAEFPDEWLSSFDSVDEIWAQSRYIQLMLARKLHKPVLYIPVALQMPPLALLTRADFGLPADRFLFFFAFDFLSFVDRKNPAGVIAAFRRAFGHMPVRSRPGLVVKTLNGSRAPAALLELRADIEQDSNIFLVERNIARTEIGSLVSMCNAVVSLHRAEGFGLLVAEALLLGCPVISTDYASTTELVSPATGFPVDYQLIPVPLDAYPFASGQVWADPDVEHAAWIMARLVNDPGIAASQIAAGRAHIERNYNPRRVAELQLSRLRELKLIK